MYNSVKREKKKCRRTTSAHKACKKKNVILFILTEERSIA